MAFFMQRLLVRHEAGLDVASVASDLRLADPDSAADCTVADHEPLAYLAALVTSHPAEEVLETLQSGAVMAEEETGPLVTGVPSWLVAAIAGIDDVKASAGRWAESGNWAWEEDDLDQLAGVLEGMVRLCREAVTANESVSHVTVIPY